MNGSPGSILVIATSTVMALAVDSVRAAVNLVVRALCDDVDGQSQPQKPEDLCETGSIRAKHKAFIGGDFLHRATHSLLLCYRRLHSRELYGDEKRPGLAEVILCASSSLRRKHS